MQLEVKTKQNKKKLKSIRSKMQYFTDVFDFLYKKIDFYFLCYFITKS